MKPLKSVCEKALADLLAGRRAGHRCAACEDEAEALLAVLKTARWSESAPEDALHRIRTRTLDRIEGPRPGPAGLGLGLATAAVFAAWIAIAPRIDLEDAPPAELAGAALEAPELLAASDLDFLESLDMMEGLDDEDWELIEMFEEEAT